MKTSMESTLWSTLIGTAVGTGIWWFGVARLIWPAHPFWAAFFVTLAATLAVQILWSKEIAKRPTR